MPSSKASTPARFARSCAATFPPPSRRPSAAELTPNAPDPTLVARLRADLDRLADPDPLGLAVSGGADSMALLLLGAAARPGGVEAISIDHGLRPEAAAEVEAVAALCATLGVPHHQARLTLEPGAGVQGRAREARYAAIADIAAQRGLGALATAHHADDQAETLLMRLGRGAGIGGLSAIRPVQRIGELTVIRPLLDWRKVDLEAVCRAAGVDWADDPSNRDERFTRAAIRSAMGGLHLNVDALGKSAAALRDAEDALDWAADREASRLQWSGDHYRLDPAGLPTELVRRLLLRAFDGLGAPAPRGPDLARAIAALAEGRPASLSGLLLSAGRDGWTIRREPARR